MTADVVIDRPPHEPTRLEPRPFQKEFVTFAESLKHIEDTISTTTPQDFANWKSEEIKTHITSRLPKKLSPAIKGSLNEALIREVASEKQLQTWWESKPTDIEKSDLVLQALHKGQSYSPKGEVKLGHKTGSIITIELDEADFSSLIIQGIETGSGVSSNAEDIQNFTKEQKALGFILEHIPEGLDIPGGAKIIAIRKGSAESVQNAFKHESTERIGRALEETIQNDHVSQLLEKLVPSHLKEEQRNFIRTRLFDIAARIQLHQDLRPGNLLSRRDTESHPTEAKILAAIIEGVREELKTPGIDRSELSYIVEGGLLRPENLVSFLQNAPFTEDQLPSPLPFGENEQVPIPTSKGRFVYYKGTFSPGEHFVSSSGETYTVVPPSSGQTTDHLGKGAFKYVYEVEDSKGNRYALKELVNKESPEIFFTRTTSGQLVARDFIYELEKVNAGHPDKPNQIVSDLFDYIGFDPHTGKFYGTPPNAEWSSFREVLVNEINSQLSSNFPNYEYSTKKFNSPYIVGGITVLLDSLSSACELAAVSSTKGKLNEDELKTGLEASKDMFKEEQTHIESLGTHPHIVGIVSKVEEQQNLLHEKKYHRIFFIEQKAPGIPISEAINTLALTPDELLTATEQIYSALEHIHTQGKTHNDIKPENIFIDKSKGTVNITLTDFGSTKKIGEEVTYGTPTHDPNGTLSHPADTRDDIYMAGITLAELLTGKRIKDENRSTIKLSGGTTLVTRDIVIKAVEDMKATTVDPGTTILIDIILKATQADKKDRFQTAKELIDTLTIEQSKISVDTTLAKMIGAADLPNLITAFRPNMIPAEKEQSIPPNVTSVLEQMKSFALANPVDTTLTFKMLGEMHDFALKNWQDPQLKSTAKIVAIKYMSSTIESLAKAGITPASNGLDLIETLLRAETDPNMLMVETGRYIVFLNTMATTNPIFTAIVDRICNLARTDTRISSTAGRRLLKDSCPKIQASKGVDLLTLTPDGFTTIEAYLASTQYNGQYGLPDEVTNYFQTLNHYLSEADPIMKKTAYDRYKDLSTSSTSWTDKRVGSLVSRIAANTLTSYAGKVPP